jgi:hypothetical protein
MFLVPLLVVHTLGVQLAKSWYGPATVTFATQFAGNPYDPATNDIRVRFTDRDGKTLERLAYYVDGTWRADLVTNTPGDYTAMLIRNGSELPEVPASETGLLVEEKLDHGFVHVNPASANRFYFDDLTPYYPIGVDLERPTAEWDAKLSEAKLNFMRPWSGTPIGRNPWWPTGPAEDGPSELWAPALNAWSKIAVDCDHNNLEYNLTLFESGAFDSRPRGGWQQNPWNVSNGGFLKSAPDFFTDPEAKRRTKMWIRYAVARYAADPNLLAFELFDQPEFTDAGRVGQWSEIAAWITEMTAYLRSLDAYDHLVTAVSEQLRPDVFKALNFYETAADNLSPEVPRPRSPWPGDKPGFLAADVDAISMTPAVATRHIVSETILENSGGVAAVLLAPDANAPAVLKELSFEAQTLIDSNFGAEGRAVIAKLRTTNCFAEALGDTNWLYLHTVAPRQTGPYETEIGGVTPSDGEYNLEIFDLLSYKVTKGSVTVSKAKIKLNLPSGDCVILVLPRT